MGSSQPTAYGREMGVKGQQKKLICMLQLIQLGAEYRNIISTVDCDTFNQNQLILLHIINTVRNNWLQRAKPPNSRYLPHKMQSGGQKESV